MKKIIYAFIAITFLVQCKSDGSGSGSGFNAKDINDPQLKDLAGTWRSTDMSLVSVAEKSDAGTSLFNSVKDGKGIMVLSKNGNYYSTQGGMGTLRNWSFESPNKINLGGASENKIEITSISADTLKGIYQLLDPQKGEAVAKVNGVWVKHNDADINWDDSTLYIWRAKPKATETDERIAARVKSLLLYNANVAATTLLKLIFAPLQLN